MTLERATARREGTARPAPHGFLLFSLLTDQVSWSPPDTRRVARVGAAATAAAARGAVVAAGEPLRRCAAWTRPPLFLSCCAACHLSQRSKSHSHHLPSGKAFCRILPSLHAWKSSSPLRISRIASHSPRLLQLCASCRTPATLCRASASEKSRARSHTRKQAQRTRSRGFGRGGERWGHLTDCICNTRLYDVSRRNQKNILRL